MVSGLLCQGPVFDPWPAQIFIKSDIFCSFIWLLCWVKIMVYGNNPPVLGLVVRQPNSVVVSETDCLVKVPGLIPSWADICLKTNICAKVLDVQCICFLCCMKMK